MLSTARSVSLLADFLADRAGQKEALRQWVSDVKLPFSTLLTGKSVLPEQLEGLAGTYAGAASAGETRRIIEDCEVIITVGVLYTDTITAGFTQQIDPQKNIDVGLNSSRAGDKSFPQVPMAEAIAVLHPLALRYRSHWHQSVTPPPVLNHEPSDSLTQNTFWQAMQDFLQPDDIVLAEPGTAEFGAVALRLSDGVIFISQPLWGSIGFTFPAAYGAQLACPDRRVVLLIGDGSAQLTAQELGVNAA